MKSKRSKHKKAVICSLAELAVGEKAVVVDIKEKSESFRRRIIEMGVTCGVKVEIKKVAPLGDPIGILVRGYELCIRKAELKGVFVEVVG